MADRLRSAIVSMRPSACPGRWWAKPDGGHWSMAMWSIQLRKQLRDYIHAPHNT